MWVVWWRVGGSLLAPGSCGHASCPTLGEVLLDTRRLCRRVTRPYEQPVPATPVGRPTLDNAPRLAIERDGPGDAAAGQRLSPAWSASGSATTVSPASIQSLGSQFDSLGFERPCPRKTVPFVRSGRPMSPCAAPSTLGVSSGWTGAAITGNRLPGTRRQRRGTGEWSGPAQTTTERSSLTVRFKQAPAEHEGPNSTFTVRSGR